MFEVSHHTKTHLKLYMYNACFQLNSPNNGTGENLPCPRINDSLRNWIPLNLCTLSIKVGGRGQETYSASVICPNLLLYIDFVPRDSLNRTTFGLIPF